MDPQFVNMSILEPPKILLRREREEVYKTNLERYFSMLETV